jgi:hypothetical protein
MKVKTLPLLAGAAGMLAITGLANAGISGLYAESVASNTLTNTVLVGTTYKIYVQFDNPADRFISAAFGDLSLQIPVYQDAAFGTDLGPHPSGLDALVPNLAADSYLAVNGGTPSGDGDYNAAAFAAGTNIIGGWFMTDPLSAANVPDANGRVLVMFLTFLGVGHPEVNGIITSPDGVDEGGLPKFSSSVLADLILGDIKFSFNPNGGVAGAITAVTVHFVPAPGALALLGVAGLVGKRRRRS